MQRHRLAELTHSHTQRIGGIRALSVVLTLGVMGFVAWSLRGSAADQRDRKRQIEALQTWEGEGGPVLESATDTPAQTPIHR
jgi:hypothetical protein